MAETAPPNQKAIQEGLIILAKVIARKVAEDHEAENDCSHSIIPRREGSVDGSENGQMGTTMYERS